MAGMVRVRFRKSVPQLDKLTFAQQEMQQMGDVAVKGLQEQVARGLNPKGESLPPLDPKYAEWKSKHGLAPIRDLTDSGSMLRSLRARWVSQNKVRATFAGRNQGLKVGVNSAGGRLPRKGSEVEPADFIGMIPGQGGRPTLYNSVRSRRMRHKALHKSAWFVGFSDATRRKINDLAQSMFKRKVDKLVQDGNKGLWTGERGL
jgi:hypothetical protein